jgi:segregation and condensation protein A
MRIYERPFAQVPQDLYIPPDAFELILEAFEGPMDLLLYLIRKDNLDILDIPIASVTRQYLTYIEWMKDLRLDLTAEYLVMAALLGEIKSRCLLPRPKTELDIEEDPRAELIRRLQEYEAFKLTSQVLDQLPRVGRDVFPVRLHPELYPISRPLPQVELAELFDALKAVFSRAQLTESHHITRELLSTRERMVKLLVI